MKTRGQALTQVTWLSENKHWLKSSEKGPPLRGPISFIIIIIKQTANLDGNQFSNFFYSLLFVSKFKSWRIIKMEMEFS